MDFKEYLLNELYRITEELGLDKKIHVAEWRSFKMPDDKKDLLFVIRYITGSYVGDIKTQPLQVFCYSELDDMTSAYMILDAFSKKHNNYQVTIDGSFIKMNFETPVSMRNFIQSETGYRASVYAFGTYVECEGIDDIKSIKWRNNDFNLAPFLTNFSTFTYDSSVPSTPTSYHNLANNRMYKVSYRLFGPEDYVFWDENENPLNFKLTIFDKRNNIVIWRTTVLFCTYTENEDNHIILTYDDETTEKTLDLGTNPDNDYKFMVEPPAGHDSFIQDSETLTQQYLEDYFYEVYNGSIYNLPDEMFEEDIPYLSGSFGYAAVLNTTKVTGEQISKSIKQEAGLTFTMTLMKTTSEFCQYVESIMLGDRTGNSDFYFTFTKTDNSRFTLILKLEQVTLPTDKTSAPNLTLMFRR